MTRFFVPALVATALLIGASGASAQEKKDIVETAVAAGQFKTLAAALTAADLVPVLKGKGPFTVLRRPMRRSRSCPRRPSKRC